MSYEEEDIYDIPVHQGPRKKNKYQGPRKKKRKELIDIPVHQGPRNLVAMIRNHGDHSKPDSGIICNSSCNAHVCE